MSDVTEAVDAKRFVPDVASLSQSALSCGHTIASVGPASDPSAPLRRKRGRPRKYPVNHLPN